MSDSLLDAWCPACGHATLAMTNDRITCLNADCHEPDAVHVLLGQQNQHLHIVQFTEDDGLTIQHPLLERADVMRGCWVAEELRVLTGPPAIGRFIVAPGQMLADMIPVDPESMRFMHEEVDESTT